MSPLWDFSSLPAPLSSQLYKFNCTRFGAPISFGNDIAVMFDLQMLASLGGFSVSAGFSCNKSPSCPWCHPSFPALYCQYEYHLWILRTSSGLRCCAIISFIASLFLIWIILYLHSWSLAQIVCERHQFQAKKTSQDLSFLTWLLHRLPALFSMGSHGTSSWISQMHGRSEFESQ